MIYSHPFTKEGTEAHFSWIPFVVSILYGFSHLLHSTKGGGGGIISHARVRKLRHRELKQLVQCSTPTVEFGCDWVFLTTNPSHLFSPCTPASCVCPYSPLGFMPFAYCMCPGAWGCAPHSRLSGDVSCWIRSTAVPFHSDQGPGRQADVIPILFFIMQGLQSGFGVGPIHRSNIPNGTGPWYLDARVSRSWQSADF
jgi:hypothetical protein